MALVSCSSALSTPSLAAFREFEAGCARTRIPGLNRCRPSRITASPSLRAADNGILAIVVQHQTERDSTMAVGIEASCTIGHGDETGPGAALTSCRAASGRQNHSPPGVKKTQSGRDRHWLRQRYLQRPAARPHGFGKGVMRSGSQRDASFDVLGFIGGADKDRRLILAQGPLNARVHPGESWAERLSSNSKTATPAAITRPSSTKRAETFRQTGHRSILARSTPTCSAWRCKLATTERWAAMAFAGAALQFRELLLPLNPRLGGGQGKAVIVEHLGRQRIGLVQLFGAVKIHLRQIAAPSPVRRGPGPVPVPPGGCQPQARREPPALVLAWRRFLQPVEHVGRASSMRAKACPALDRVALVHQHFNHRSSQFKADSRAAIALNHGPLKCDSAASYSPLRRAWY